MNDTCDVKICPTVNSTLYTLARTYKGGAYTIADNIIYDGDSIDRAAWCTVWLIGCMHTRTYPTMKHALQLYHVRVAHEQKWGWFQSSQISLHAPHMALNNCPYNFALDPHLVPMPLSIKRKKRDEDSFNRHVTTWNWEHTQRQFSFIFIPSSPLTISKTQTKSKVISQIQYRPRFSSLSLLLRPHCMTHSFPA